MAEQNPSEPYEDTDSTPSYGHSPGYVSLVEKTDATGSPKGYYTFKVTKEQATKTTGGRDEKVIVGPIHVGDPTKVAHALRKKFPLGYKSNGKKEDWFKVATEEEAKESFQDVIDQVKKGQNKP